MYRLNLRFIFIITVYSILTLLAIIISLSPLTYYSYFVLQSKDYLYYLSFPVIGLLFWLISFMIFVTIHGRLISRFFLPQIKEGSYPLKSRTNLIYSIRLSADNIAKYWCKTFEIIPFLTQLYLNKVFLSAYEVKFGKNTYIAIELSIDGILLIEFGDNVFIDHRTIVGAHINHDRDELGGNILYKHVKVWNNCFIGYNAGLIPDVKMGNKSVLGANSVALLNVDIPENETWVGMPAKFMKKNGNPKIQY